MSSLLSTASFICDENIQKLFPLQSIGDVVQLFRLHLESAKEPNLTLLSIVTGIIENTLTSKCGTVSAVASVQQQLARDGAVSPVANNNTKTASNKASNGVQSQSLTTTQSQPKQTLNANGDADSVVGTLNTFPVVEYETVQSLYEQFRTILSIVEDTTRSTVLGRHLFADAKRLKSGQNVTSTTALAAAAATAASLTKLTTTNLPTPTVVKKTAAGNDGTPIYATREIIKRVSDVIWNSLIRSTYKDRAHLQSLYSYLALSKLDCFGVALAVVAGCQMLGYNDVHLAISEDHAWVVFGKTCDETIEVTWHGKGAEDKRGQSVIQGYESHSWLYLAGNPVVCDRFIEAAAIVSSINPSLSASSCCLEVADLQQQLLWLLYDMQHLQRYPMGLGCLGELEEVSETKNRPSCETLYAAAVKAAQLNYKNHHVYPYTYQGGYYYRQQQYKEAFAAWANAGDVIRLYNYSRDDEEIYKEFLDIANELIPHVMKTESSGHSAKSVLRDAHCFANLLRFYDGICRWEEGSQTPILHIGWAKPLVTTISRFDYDIRSQVIINCAKDDEEVNGAYTNVRQESNNNITTPKAKVIDVFNTDHQLISNNLKQNKDDKKDDVSVPPSAETVRTSLVEVLAAACGEKILNPDFLLQGGGKPFADQQNQQNAEADQRDKKLLNIQQQQQQLLKGQEADGKSKFTPLKEVKKENDEIVSIASPQSQTAPPPSNAVSVIKNASAIMRDTDANSKTPTANVDNEPKPPAITLYSQKMKGLKELLLAEKLNTHAISLQVTAQSQVQVGGKKNRHSIGNTNYSTSKRSRRD